MMEEKIAWTWAKHNCTIWDDEMRGHAKQALISHNGHPEVGDRVLEKMKKVTRGSLITNCGCGNEGIVALTGCVHFSMYGVLAKTGRRWRL